MRFSVPDVYVVPWSREIPLAEFARSRMGMRVARLTHAGIRGFRRTTGRYQEWSHVVKYVPDGWDDGRQIHGRKGRDRVSVPVDVWPDC